MTYFAHARTALKSGLTFLGCKPGDRILVPEYICDALIHPIRHLDIIPVYYPVDDQFKPLWECLSQLVFPKACRAIVMVHYFGQPQDILRFQRFSKKHNLFLIEDNAHGFGGRNSGRLLGTFGDIGIVSPRKLLNTKYGGQLYVSDTLQSTPENLKKKHQNIAYWAVKNLLSSCPTIRKSLFRYFGRIPNFHDATSFKEPEVKDGAADWFSSWIIDRVSNNISLDRIAKKQRQKWVSINYIIKEMGGEPAFAQVSEQSSPWAFPFYTNNEKQREKIINYLFSKGYKVFTWPALPSEILSDGSYKDSADRWHRLLCVSL